MSGMNPLRWSLEHRIAFCIAVLLGAGLGLLAELLRYGQDKWHMLFTMALGGPTGDVGEINERLTAYSRQLMLTGSMIGAAIAGSVFYIVKLWQAGNRGR